MVILSSPSGVGKTTITKKFNKNTILLNFQSLTLQENQDQTKLTELIIILLQKKNLKNQSKVTIFMNMQKYLIITMVQKKKKLTKL